MLDEEEETQILNLVLYIFRLCVRTIVMKNNMCRIK